MNAVRKVWVDDENFVVDLRVEGGVALVYAFPIKELQSGASLARMMNLKVRETLKTSGALVSETALSAAARQGIAALREIIEPYFEARGL